MIRLRWTRTVLAALGFVWIMLEWRHVQSLQTRDRAYAEALIERVCSAMGASKDQCEVGLRSGGLIGKGINVHGTVQMDGSVQLGR